jgi:hypothetical protein
MVASHQQELDLDEWKQQGNARHSLRMLSYYIEVIFKYKGLVITMLPFT